MTKRIIFVLILGFLWNNCKEKTDMTKESVLLVLSKKGEVELIRDNKTEPLQLNSFVVKGDLIQTKAGSSVDLEFPGGALLRVKENSSLRINSILFQENTQVELNLLKGKVFAKIKNKLKEKESFRIKTPTMIAGVRGTEFSVSEDEIPKIMVLEGEVSAEKEAIPTIAVVSGKKAEGEGLVISDLTPEEKSELEADSGNLLPSTLEFRENSQKLYNEFKESQKILLEEQKSKNQDELRGQIESNQNNLNNQIETDQDNLNTQKEKNREDMRNQTGQDKSNLSEQKDSGKKEASDIKSKGKEALSGVKKDVESEKERINSAKNSMDTIKNQNLMESVKPKK